MVYYPKLFFVYLLIGSGPYKYYTTSFAKLQAYGKAQGIDIRPIFQGGDI
jgi:hypothetical protein